MKTKIKSSLILALFVLATGCSAFLLKHADPLAGWRVSDLKCLNANRAITDDYKNYIHALSAENQKSVDGVEFFEDGTGQHAVRITISYSRKVWEHVLIYDNGNKRTKVVRYFAGNYAS